jgi:ABC-2 type transport system permease protein
VREALASKAWRESRGRFLVSAAVVAGLCVVFVLFQAELRERMGATRSPANTYVGYIYIRVYAGVVRAIFLILTVLLGLGGLQRERELGTLGFTLALPVPRFQHFAARALVGLLEVAALAWLPAVLVPLTSVVVGEHYAWRQAAEFALLWTAGGALVLSVGLVVSSALRSIYIALMVALLILQQMPSLLRNVMNGTGMAYFDPRSAELVGAVPWLVVIGVVGVALAFLAIGATVTARQGLS